MPAYQQAKPTTEQPRQPGASAQDQGEADSVSPQSRGESVQEKPMPTQGTAKVGAEPVPGKAEPVDCQVVTDSMGNLKPHKARHGKAEQVKALVIREGMSIEGAAHVVGLSAQTVDRIVNASGEEMESLEKQLVPRKFKISTMADELLIQKMRNDGHRMSGSELSIISGVAVQRAADVMKMPRKEQPPDWSQLAGWAGSPNDDAPTTGSVIAPVLPIP